MQDIYITEERWDALVAALLDIRPANPFTGRIEESDIATVLGEVGGIWPASVLEDQARGYQLHRANHAIRATSEDRTVDAVEALLDDF